jgi:hypothetical protein
MLVKGVVPYTYHHLYTLTFTFHNLPSHVITHAIANSPSMCAQQGHFVPFVQLFDDYIKDLFLCFGLIFHTLLHINSLFKLKYHPEKTH